MKKVLENMNQLKKNYEESLSNVEENSIISIRVY